MGLGNAPLVYVDGIRINSASESGPNIRGGRMASRMNDIDPEDIESIEIIKGPAAATLYGTEASNGVIQIITKKGSTGAPVIEFSTRQGVNYIDSPADRFWWTYWYHCPQNNPRPDLQVCTAAQIAANAGVTDSMNLYADEEAAGRPVFTNGPQRNYNGNIRGGTDAVRYFVSAGYDDETGIVPYNFNKALNLRTNISATPSESWDMNVSLGFNRGETRFAQAANPYGIWEAIIWARPDTRYNQFRGFRYQTPESAALVDSRSWVNRFISSFQVTHRPLSWLTQRAIVGLDYGTENGRT
jgi:TonB-dependent SusC/RagA subfamily outer membrane receptor